MRRKDIQLLDDFASQYIDRLGKFIKRYKDVNGLFFIDTIKPSLNFITDTYELMYKNDEVWYEWMLNQLYWLTSFSDGFENEDEGEHVDWHWLSEIGYFLFHQVDDYYKGVENLGGIDNYKEALLRRLKKHGMLDDN